MNISISNNHKTNKRNTKLEQLFFHIPASRSVEEKENTWTTIIDIKRENFLFLLIGLFFPDTLKKSSFFCIISQEQDSFTAKIAKTTKTFAKLNIRRSQR